MNILIAKPGSEYELIDSGNGEKLERYGTFSISRPDPQALWQKFAPDTWGKADAHFSTTLPTESSVEKNGESSKTSKAASKGGWNLRPGMPEKWKITYEGLSFWIRPTSFKHTGLFPEQAENWKWIRQSIAAHVNKFPGKKVSVLNLFGYTGGATLAAAQAGAEVVHVDGSRTAITWARANAEASGLATKPIRWILDDAKAFVKREAKRGNTYDAIIMDPPSFGRGPKGEVWKIEDDFPELLELSASLLTSNPAFVLINGYAAGYSALAYKQSLDGLLLKKGLGTGASGKKNSDGAHHEVEAGELAIHESAGKRLLPAGIFARWRPQE